MSIEQYVYDLRTILKYVDYNFKTVREIADVLWEAHKNGNRIYVMGNGGSATTASHIAGDLNKTCGLKAMALTDSNYLITAWANDEGYAEIFRQQLSRFLDEGDVVLVISGSGESENIYRALTIAKEWGVRTIGLTGFQGGAVKGLADICLIVPSEVMEQIEDIHLMIGHILVTELKNRKG